MLFLMGVATSRLAVMTQEDKIRANIEQIFTRGPWHDICPVEEAIQGAMDYRNHLKPASLDLFDNLIIKGVLPENAIETVQFAIDHGYLADQSEILTVR
jgi:hypothetical protein